MLIILFGYNNINLATENSTISFAFSSVFLLVYKHTTQRYYIKIPYSSSVANTIERFLTDIISRFQTKINRINTKISNNDTIQIF